MLRLLFCSASAPLNTPRNQIAAILRGSLVVMFMAGTNASHVDAEDWPQWRGPSRNGISPETEWFQGWQDGRTPTVLWRAEVGKGHSSVSIVGGRAYTMGWDGTEDTVYCFDAATGREIWKQSYPCRTILQWPGPRSTPTVHGGAVFTLGQHGQLRAWNASSGQPLWQRDLPDDYNPDVDYGFAWSPLMESGDDGDLLILNAGSRGLAIRARDGSIAWGDDRQKSACVSAVPFEQNGARGVLVVGINADRSAANLVGVDPRSGRQLWRFDGWPEQWGAMGVDPIIDDGKVFITSAEQHRQAARYSIDGGTLRLDWSSRVAGYTGCAVLLNAHLYLVDSNGILKCMDWETGAVRWNQRGFDERGTLIAADGKLLIQAGASGNLIIVGADPTGYVELGRVQVFEGSPATFTAPVLSGGRIYCRSYAGEVVCLQSGPSE